MGEHEIQLTDSNSSIFKNVQDLLSLSCPASKLDKLKRIWEPTYMWVILLKDILYIYPLFLNQYKVLKMKTHLESFRAQTVALDHSARGVVRFSILILYMFISKLVSKCLCLMFNVIYKVLFYVSPISKVY